MNEKLECRICGKQIDTTFVPELEQEVIKGYGCKMCRNIKRWNGRYF